MSRNVQSVDCFDQPKRSISWCQRRQDARADKSSGAKCRNRRSSALPVSDEVQQDRTRSGSVKETLVFGELFKHMTTADGDYQLMGYRDNDKLEVDMVIENVAGQLVGVEVKPALAWRRAMT
ncbi:MAG: DUF4143 domain-containing protein [Betaproteobacteria bacterium]|nr:DUF4143 domain-containing protein [Betaproteobacteria bacterium]